MRATLPTRRSRTIGKPSAIRHVPAIRPMRWRFFRRLGPPESLSTQRKRRTEERTAPILRRAKPASESGRAERQARRRPVAAPSPARRRPMRSGLAWRARKACACSDTVADPSLGLAGARGRCRHVGSGNARHPTEHGRSAAGKHPDGARRACRAPGRASRPARRHRTDQPAPDALGNSAVLQPQGRRPRAKSPEPTGEARRADASALRPARQASWPARARSRNGTFPDGGLFRASAPKPRRCRKEIVETCGGALEITDARRHRRAHSLPVSASRTRSKAAGSGRTRAASRAMNRNRPCMNLP